jgi:hypothetical protein
VSQTLAAFPSLGTKALVPYIIRKTFVVLASSFRSQPLRLNMEDEIIDGLANIQAQFCAIAREKKVILEPRCRNCFNQTEGHGRPWGADKCLKERIEFNDLRLQFQEEVAMGRQGTPSPRHSPLDPAGSVFQDQADGNHLGGLSSKKKKTGFFATMK